jgi:hypothetical protein
MPGNGIGRSQEAIFPRTREVEDFGYGAFGAPARSVAWAGLAGVDALAWASLFAVWASSWACVERRVSPFAAAVSF